MSYERQPGSEGKSLLLQSCLNIICISLLFAGSLSAESVLPDTIDKVKKSIVAVGTFQANRHPRGLFLGTGFAVGDGSLIVTNEHVVDATLDKKQNESFAVFFRIKGKEQVVIANKIAQDIEHDIALLKLQGVRIPPLRLGDAGKVREGQLFAFTGFPIGMVLGLYPVTHRGIISAISPIAIPVLGSNQLSKKMLKRLGAPHSVFQLDATAYPGNSGSPLYHPETAEVIGVINKVFVKETKEKVLSHPSGISYAIPVGFVKQLLK